MRARRRILASRAAAATLFTGALVVAALVAVIGSAQAAPSKKVYSATVRLTDATTSLSTFTLKLTNDPSSQQTLGSANFMPPSGIALGAVVGAADRAGWTATLQDGAVAFRSASSTVALPRGASVSAAVSVTIAPSCSATWTTRAKQSNDFSGQPGNDAQLDAAASDLTPLGSFSVSTIETIEGGQSIPAVITGQSKTWTVTANDTCGATKTSYSGATLTRTFLTGAGFTPASGLSWSSGVGTVTFTPHVTETGNNLTVTDDLTKVTNTSNDFDVSDTLCTPADTEPCHWQDKQGNPGILADATSPPSGANLGIGFNSSELSPPRENFSCNKPGDTDPAPVGGSVVNINPRGYAVPFTVSLTYKKSVTGSGPASGFVFCLSEDIDGSTWTTPPACPSTPTPANAPCVLTQKRSGGDLLIILYLTQGDPWGGLT